MPQEFIKPRGSSRGSRPDAGGANTRMAPVFGIVKDNIDPNRAGRLRVYISDFSGQDPDDSDNWVTVSYMSTFFGSVRPKAGETGYGTYKDNPSSYGEWHAPPDIGTTVICIFINGDMNYGFYIGCVPDAESLQMVPAIGALDTSVPNEDEARSYGGASRLPVTNMNTNNQADVDSPEFLSTARPVHSYSAAIMAQQGIIRDAIRGPISSSSQREPASRVGWGISTPGRPIYEGGYDDTTIATKIEGANPESLRIVARRGGHSIVMDDGDVIGRDQLVRIRTAKGHQILMSDDGQTLMILHSNGQSYIELGKEGTIDMYSTNSVNIRTHGDLNLHADNNVNIHAAKDFNIQAENMHVTTQKSLKQSIGLNWTTSALGMVTTKATGAMSLQATGLASLSSSAITYINGGVINLNTGKSPIIPQDVPPITLVSHTDTIFDQQKGFTAAPGKLLSITSRAPAHAPWAHAGQGVDVQIDLSALSQLSSGPSSLLSGALKAGLATGAAPVKLATALSSPVTGTISKSLNESATGALVGATAQLASQSPLSPAIQNGAAIVDVDGKKVAAVGSFAQTPAQLASSGVLKPGSDKLVASLVSSGANVTQAFPNSVFSGNFGAENLPDYTKNIQTQTSSVVTNLQRSQTTLTNSGVITGNEAPDQIAGVVLAGASSGTANTIATVRTSINETTIEKAVLNQIGTGSLSASFTTSTSGGAGSITEAVNAMTASPAISGSIDTSRGVTGSAFSAITQSYPDFKAGVPANLAGAVSGQQLTANALAGQPGQIGSSIISNINTADLGSSSLAQGTSVLKNSEIASGIVNLPGGFSAVSSLVDKSISGISQLAGTAGLKGLIDSKATAAINNLPLPASISIGGLKSTLTVGSAVGIASAVSSVLSLFGGKGRVRTASPAVNTTTRTTVDDKSKSLLGDAKIPAPDFSGEVSAEAVQATETRKLLNDQILELTKQIGKINADITRISRTEGAQISADEREAPAGDPNIKKRKDELRRKIGKLADERNELVKQRMELQNKR
jgi:hypothetical protein